MKGGRRLFEGLIGEVAVGFVDESDHFLVIGRVG
jgi:hypothetical protein